MVGAKTTSNRKRGRPSGKNRTPLSLEERRARNAQYERERRNETTEAINELALAMDVHPGISQKELLALVINYLDKMKLRDRSEDLQTLRQRNEKLMEQIQSIETRIQTDPKLKGLTSGVAQKPLSFIKSRTKKNVSPVEFMSNVISTDEESSIGNLKTKSKVIEHESSGSLDGNSRNIKLKKKPSVLSAVHIKSESEDLLSADEDDSNDSETDQASGNSDYYPVQNTQLLKAHGLSPNEVLKNSSQSSSSPVDTSCDQFYYRDAILNHFPASVPENFLSSDAE